MAAADDVDPDHQRCRAVVENHPGPLVTTALVVAEAGWLIERQLGPVAEAGFYRSIVAGDLRVEALELGPQRNFARAGVAWTTMGSVSGLVTSPGSPRMSI